MKVVVERIANVLEEFEATGERMKDATVQKKQSPESADGKALLKQWRLFGKTQQEIVEIDFQGRSITYHIRCFLNMTCQVIRSHLENRQQPFQKVT